MSTTVLERDVKQQSRLTIVDCDLHPTLRGGFTDLKPYLAKKWWEHLETYGPLLRHGMSKTSPHPKMAPSIARIDAWPPDGTPAGSSLPFMREQHLDPNGVEFGMLQPLNPGPSLRNASFAVALCSSFNDWQIEGWTAHDKRLKGSIVVYPEDVPAAVAEIHRRAKSSDFAQIAFPPRAFLPPGHKNYWPIYEACVEHNLPVGMHIQGYNGHAQMGTGFPTYYIEDHHCIVQIMQSTAMSFIFEGVFERFPTLKVVLIEGGFGWVPAMKWRMDKHFDRMHSEVPHLKRKPSEYMHDNIYFTTQPIEEPDRPQDLINMIDQIGWDRILFSTDYPHWDFDDPKQILKYPMTPAQRAQLLRGNAKELYRLA